MDHYTKIEICDDLKSTQEEMDAAFEVTRELLEKWKGGNSSQTQIINDIVATPFQPNVKLWMALKLGRASMLVEHPIIQILNDL